VTDLDYRFVAFTRRGAAARITDLLPPDSGRAMPTFDVSVSRLGPTPAGPLVATSPHLPILGPMDVLGIDPTQVLRVAPVANDHDAEPNYLAAIEFRHPDLPWLFTPRGPEAAGGVGAGRLRPWIALVVVPDEDGTRVTSVPGSPNPVLLAKPGDLPDLAESWAWAHVQVLGTDAQGPIDDPGQFGRAVRSRLLCPRRLEPDVSYVACVVPTFRSGALIGLGLGVADVKANAWDGNEVRLPVYHHWRFRTGPAGDFESLARKLRPVKVTDLPGVGLRPVLVDAVLSRLEKNRPFPAFVLNVATAVTVPNTTPGQIGQPPGPLAPTSANPGPARDAINQRLTTILDRPERLRRQNDEQPTVGPPIYGQWHAGVRSIADPLAPPDGSPAVQPTPEWIRELDLDPEPRTAAGVGTTVVQHDQEELMASAWEQLEAVVRANQQARWGQLFREASVTLHARRIEPRTGVSALRLARPALARLREGDGLDPAPTLSKRFADTPAPASLFGPAFARTSRLASRAVDRTIGANAGAQRVAPLGVLQGIGPGLLEGRQRIATRFDGPRMRLDAGAMGALLGRTGIADHIAEVSDVPLDRIIEDLGRLPELVAEVAETVVVQPEDLDVHIDDLIVEGLGARITEPGGGMVVEPGGPGEVFQPGGPAEIVGGGANVVDISSGLGSVIGGAAGPTISHLPSNLGSILGGVHTMPPAGLSAVLHAHAVSGAFGLTGSPALADLAVAPLALAQPQLKRVLRGDDRIEFKQLATAAAAKIAAGEHAAPPEVLVELQAIAGLPDGAVVSNVSAGAFDTVNAMADGNVIAGAALSAGPALSSHSISTFASIAKAAQVPQQVVVANLRASTISALIASTFKVAQPVVVARPLIGLSPEIIGAIVGQIEQDLPKVVLPDRLKVPPAFFQPIVAAEAHRLVAQRLQPRVNYERMLSWAIRIQDDRARRRSEADPIMAAPQFPDPFLERVKKIDQDWILGGANTIPPDSLTIMGDNRRFVEACLVGANHEMGRELLWRAYPTDQRGTTFARFWPAGAPGALADGDIAPIHTWTNGLGGNPPGLGQVDDMTILVVRGELLRRYPRTIVSAIPGKAIEDDGDPTFQPSTTREAVPERFRFALAPDITCVGLAISTENLKQAAGPGEEWFIALSQPVEEPRFGLDETDEPGLRLDEDDLAWPMISSAIANAHIDLAAVDPNLFPPASLDAAYIACRLFQRPFQLILRAREYLP
jgi:hypothetical protein